MVGYDFFESKDKDDRTGPANTSLQPDAMQFFESGRWCRGAIPLGSKDAFANQFLLISFYNFVGRDH